MLAKDLNWLVAIVVTLNKSVRGGGYKTADDCLNEHWIRLRLLAVRIKCHSVILG